MTIQRAAYFKGVRLWQWLQEPEAWAQRTVEQAHDGIGQSHVTRTANSPNFDREAKIDCIVAYTTATSDLATLTTFEHVLNDVEADLITNSTGEGCLTICDDPARKANVTVGPYVGAGAVQVVTYDTIGGSWTPTVNRYCLCRNPSSGAGFYSIISAVVASTSLSIVIPTGTTVTTAWDVVDVQTVYPYATYRRMHGGSARQSGIDSANGPQWRADVSYYFGVRGATVMAAAHIPAHDDS